MALPTYYNTGTVDVVNGQTGVVGHGTSWAAYVSANDLFTLGGSIVRVASVTDNTHLVLAQAWPGTSQNLVAYEVQITPGGSAVTAGVRTVLDGLNSGSLQNVSGGAFLKANPDSVIFTKTGAGTISIKGGSTIGIGSSVYTFDTDTAVTMPSLAAGTDYAIYMCNDGTVRADANFSAPSGYSTSTSRKIGGFHYAPGGNATAQAGGDTTPAINPYSIWDLKWRPACPDPRGMALIGSGFWCDIYLCNTAPEANGTSGYNLTIADGGSPPKIPTAFGGNGTTAYGDFNWWEAAEVMSAAGKQLLSYLEFAAAMYGTTEGAAYGTDPGSTVLRIAYTSRWGIMLATGNMWVWGRDLNYYLAGGAIATDEAFSWHDNTQSRGQIYSQGTYGLNAALFGGIWSSGANCGSRASSWSHYPWYSGSDIGARGRADHLRLA